MAPTPPRFATWGGPALSTGEPEAVAHRVTHPARLLTVARWTASFDRCTALASRDDNERPPDVSWAEEPLRSNASGRLAPAKPASRSSAGRIRASSICCCKLGLIGPGARSSRSLPHAARTVSALAVEPTSWTPSATPSPTRRPHLVAVADKLSFRAAAEVFPPGSARPAYDQLAPAKGASTGATPDGMPLSCAQTQASDAGWRSGNGRILMLADKGPTSYLLCPTGLERRQALRDSWLTELQSFPSPSRTGRPGFCRDSDEPPQMLPWRNHGTVEILDS